MKIYSSPSFKEFSSSFFCTLSLFLFLPLFSHILWKTTNYEICEKYVGSSSTTDISGHHMERLVFVRMNYMVPSLLPARTSMSSWLHLRAKLLRMCSSSSSPRTASNEGIGGSLRASVMTAAASCACHGWASASTRSLTVGSY